LTGSVGGHLSRSAATGIAVAVCSHAGLSFELNHALKLDCEHCVDCASAKAKTTSPFGFVSPVWRKPKTALLAT